MTTKKTKTKEGRKNLLTEVCSARYLSTEEKKTWLEHCEIQKKLIDEQQELIAKEEAKKKEREPLLEKAEEEKEKSDPALLKEVLALSRELTDIVKERKERAEELFSEMDFINGLIKDATDRYLNGLETSESVYKDAMSIIAGVTKEDFQESVREVNRSFDRKNDPKTWKESADFRKYSHFNFTSARVFLLHMVKPHIEYLEKKAETHEAFGMKYTEVIDVMIYMKVKDEFEYKLPTGEKTVPKEKEVITVGDLEETGAYAKRIEDRFVRAVESSIGENAKLDKIVDSKMMTSGGFPLQYNFEGTGLSEEQMQDMVITSEACIIFDMLLEKVTKKIPTFPKKTESGLPSAADLEKIDSVIKEEACRTVFLSRDEYVKERNITPNRSRQKDTFEYAVMSIGSIYGYYDNTPYNFFSSPPHEPSDMYNKNGIEAIFNYDWIRRLYNGAGQIGYTPRSLRSADFKKHKYVFAIWYTLYNHYKTNVGKGNPHTNRTKIENIINKVSELRKKEEEQSQGKKDYHSNVIAPLLENLDAMKKVYGTIDYEILDKNKKPLPKSRFLQLKYRDKKDCWIRFRFIDYPADDWNPTEPLSKEDTKTPYWTAFFEKKAKKKAKKEN